jgi:hypothetical protein
MHRMFLALDYRGVLDDDGASETWRSGFAVGPCPGTNLWYLGTPDHQAGWSVDHQIQRGQLLKPKPRRPSEKVQPINQPSYSPSTS